MIKVLWGEREMKFFIIISTIIIFYLGFIFIDKICALFEPIDFTDNKMNTAPNSNESLDVLLFGSNKISSDIAEILDRLNITYKLIKNTSELNNNDSYKYIFAVDKLDLENLMICSLCKKIMGVTNFLAICNCSYNKKIFEDNHIPYLFGEDIQASQIVKALLSPSQNSGGIFNVHI